MAFVTLGATQGMWVRRSSRPTSSPFLRQGRFSGERRNALRLYSGRPPLRTGSCRRHRLPLSCPWQPPRWVVPRFPARPAGPLAPVVALPRPLLARAVGDLRMEVTPLGHPVLPGPLLELETFRVLAPVKEAPKLPLVGPPKEREKGALRLPLVGLPMAREKLGMIPVLFRWLRGRAKASQPLPRLVKVMVRDGRIGQTTPCPRLRLPGTLAMHGASVTGSPLLGGALVLPHGTQGGTQAKRLWLSTQRNPQLVRACQVAW